MVGGTRLVVVLACVSALTVGLVAPADAAHRRPLRQAHACAYYLPLEYTETPRLDLQVQAGRWYAADRSSIPCWDQMYDDYRPGVRGSFRATVRWYVGKRLVSTVRHRVANTGWDESSYFRFERDGLHQVSRYGWAVGHRRVVARVTITKKGYRTVRLRVAEFHYPPE